MKLENLKKLFSDPLPNLVLSILLGLSLAVTLVTFSRVKRHQADTLREGTDRILSNIRLRLSRYENALLHLRSHMITTPVMTRNNFQHYVENLTIFQNYPGVQGLGYTERIPPGEIEQFYQRIRKDLPEFKIWPDFERDIYFTIVYLEPLNWRNRRAIGYDMYSEPIRRKAMDRAMETGEASMTGMVKLVQETETSTQPGFLIYVPLFDGNIIPQTVQARRKALKGFVYAPFRFVDFVENLFLSDLNTHRDIHVQIYDGARAHEQHIYYDNDHLFNESRHHTSFHTTVTETVRIFGHDWTVVTGLKKNTPFFLTYFVPISVGSFCTLISFLLSWILYSARAHAREAQINVARHNAILENLTEGLIFVDAHGRALMMNSEALRIHEFESIAEMEKVASNYTPLFEARTLEGHLIPVEGWPIILLSKGKKFRDYEVKIRRVDTGKEWIGSYGGAPVYDEDGNFIMGVMTVREITEQKRIEEELKLAIKHRDEFLSLASHELKTPLTTLKLQSQLFKRLLDRDDPKALEKDRIRNFSEQTEKQVRRLNRLIDDMLDISRIRTGRLSLNKEVVNLKQLVLDIVDRLKPLFEEEKYPPLRFMSEGEMMGNWDILRIEQVVLNLLTNAIRYGNGKEITIKLNTTNGMAHLCVIDQGMGIPREDFEKIFQRFERATVPSDVSGLGLGLYLTRQIVQAHEGKIWVESELGKGSTFHVELPLSSGPRSSDSIEVV